MREITAILSGFDRLSAEGKSAALATVVRVEGSSFRRPGARMLVAEDGRTWGGVSGGCLERDVARRARGVIACGASEIHRYDTSDDYDTGTALGCAGLIDIFIEPLSAARPGPIPALRRAVIDRRPVTIAMVVRSASADLVPGDRFGMGAVATRFDAELEEVERSGAGSYRALDGAEIFFERIAPPQSLVLFGGGPDVVPVVGLAKQLGWHVTVIASHAAPGAAERFTAADRLAIGSDDDPLGGVTLEPAAAVVLMTHNYPRDLALLPKLLAIAPRYLGLLGPRRRAESLVIEAPGVAPETINRLYAPVGLDIGANTPEAIGLSIVAEIQAVLAGRPCPSLRDRTGPIYPQDAPANPAPYHPVSCPMSA